MGRGGGWPRRISVTSDPGTATGYSAGVITFIGVITLIGSVRLSERWLQRKPHIIDIPLRTSTSTKTTTSLTSTSTRTTSTSTSTSTSTTTNPIKWTKETLHRIAFFDEGGGTLVQEWRDFQASLVARMEPVEGHLKILIVVGVSKAMLNMLAATMRKFEESKAGDKFDLALFRYDEPAGKPSALEGEDGETLWRHVVMHEAGPSCHIQRWQRVTPEFAKAYDYVWHIDGDISADFFNWDIYRHYLLTLRPLAVQPAALGNQGDPVALGSWWGTLRMEPPLDDGTIAAAAEVWWVETMFPMFSSKFWPFLHQRMMRQSGLNVFTMENFWNNMLNDLLSQHCINTSGLVINLSPFRHRNMKDYFASGSKCSKGKPAEECGNATQEEVDLLAASFCPSGKATDNTSWPDRTACDPPKVTAQLRKWRVPYDKVTPILPISNARVTAR